MIDELDAQAERAFQLGVRVGLHAWGVEQKFADDGHDKVFEVLESIARGDTTLIGTPEEVIKDARLTPALADMTHRTLGDSRRNERRMAQIILNSMFPEAYPLD